MDCDLIMFRSVFPVLASLLLVACGAVEGMRVNPSPLPVEVNVIAVQVVQDTTNSVPLVGGKETLLLLEEPVGIIAAEDAEGIVSVPVGDGVATVRFSEPNPLTINFLPLRYEGAEPVITDQFLEEARVAILEVLPYSSVDFEVLPTVDVSGTGDELWRNTITVARANGKPGVTTYGLLPHLTGEKFRGWANTGYPYAASVLRNWDGSVNYSTIVHELAHTLGARHAPCGDPANADVDYPEEGAVVTDIMYSNVSKEMVTDKFDLMSYCYPRWPSAYTYTRMLAGLGR